ncbi:MAG: aldo/keto reductase [Opitutales bacterium]
MQLVTLGKSTVTSSRLIYGCMRICGDGSTEARKKGCQALLAAYEAGYTHFDHADIYGKGICEELHGELFKEEPALRERTFLTSKCGIRAADTPNKGDPARYDFSKSYILNQVDRSLKRLGVETLDTLLLHRPDYLFHPEEVAAAFSELLEAGKARHFGVSNFRPSQVSLLQSACPMPLLMHQVEINIHRVAALEDGTLDQCLEHGITPTAWCPLGGVAYPAWGNTFTPEDETRVAAELKRQAEFYGIEPWQVMIAWLLVLPSGVAPIIGSTTPERIAAAVACLEIEYSREDFYRLLEARNGRAAP